jgi:hypothetical protein
MSGSVPLFNIFLHVRRGPSPILAASIEEAVEEAIKLVQLEPFQITEGKSRVLMDEAQLRAGLRDRVA